MPLTRTNEWDIREFNQFLIDNATAAFAWGTNDCCMFPANAIQAFTGVDIGADFRGQYTDKASAFAAIQTIAAGTTVADAVAYCAAQHGLIEYEHPLCAQRGDLVVIKQAAVAVADRLIAGVVHLSGVHLVTVGEGGLVRMPITAVQRAWKV